MNTFICSATYAPLLDSYAPYVYFHHPSSHNLRVFFDLIPSLFRLFFWSLPILIYTHAQLTCTDISYGSE